MKELFELQQRLVATKTNWNEFSSFSYRSLEDILQKAKPLLNELKCVITLTDEMVLLGDRYYIKSIATLQNENGEKESAIGWAREPLELKGMSAPQVTGTASSYARKYALASLLAIDDNKDIDSLDNRTKQQKPSVNNIPIVDNNLELSPEQVKGNFVGYINNVPEKSNKEKLTEFYLSIKDNPTTNLNELNKFYNYYSTKDFKGNIECTKLWSSWLSRIRN